jgi:hypothetical protein
MLRLFRRRRWFVREVAEGRRRKGELSRHKKGVDPFVTLRISNVIRKLLASAVAPLPSGVILHAG